MIRLPPAVLFLCLYYLDIIILIFISIIIDYAILNLCKKEEIVHPPTMTEVRGQSHQISDVVPHIRVTNNSKTFFD